MLGNVEHFPDEDSDSDPISSSSDLIATEESEVSESEPSGSEGSGLDGRSHAPGDTGVDVDFEYGITLYQRASHLTFKFVTDASFGAFERQMISPVRGCYSESGTSVLKTRTPCSGMIYERLPESERGKESR